MSHCVACDTTLSSAKKWKIFEKDSELEIDDEENLCSVCLSAAATAYHEMGYLSNAAIEQDCKEMFYDEWANVSSPILEMLDGKY